MYYPRLNKRAVTRSTLDRFYGYDCRPGAMEGSFCEMENISCRLFPLLSSRKPRAICEEIEDCQGLISKDALIWVSGGRLYINGEASPLEGLSPGEKQLVSMGAYVCVFPDKRYLNTADPADFGSMEAKWSFEGSMRCAMCDAQGQELEKMSFAPTAPEEPADGELWINSGDGSLLRYSEVNGLWLSAESIYCRLSFASQGQIPQLFSAYDGVEISLPELPELEGSKIINAMGGSAGEQAEDDYIVLICEKAFETRTFQGSISIQRQVPDMDFVCQCNNRLWGCRYGNDGKENINELYACALGDFKNWGQFMGLSTDSWRASVGSDGPWTGAVGYLDTPIFFKEDRIHRIGVSPTGAHRVSESVGRGVQKGSHKSLQIVDETLYYKSPTEICAYQGGFGQGVSAALGDRRYSAAIAGVAGQNYYISMLDELGKRQLFVYDTAKGLWTREDELDTRDFASWGNELYCISGGKLIALEGSRGDKEREVQWRARTGMLTASKPGQKYISRLNLRLAMEYKAQMELFVEYDSSGVWEFAGRIRMERTGSVELPLPLRRCDHLRLEMRGWGEMKLFSITREMSAY